MIWLRSEGQKRYGGAGPPPVYAALRRDKDCVNVVPKRLVIEETVLFSLLSEKPKCLRVVGVQ